MTYDNDIFDKQHNQSEKTENDFSVPIQKERKNKNEKQSLFNINKLFAGSEVKKSDNIQKNFDFTSEKTMFAEESNDTFVPQKSSSFKVTTRISTDTSATMKA